MNALDQREQKGSKGAADWGTYDAIVIGGGIAGAAAASTLAIAGRRVALIEPTGTLGREITRAYNSFVRLDDYVDRSPAIHEWLSCLKARLGWHDGQLDPVVAALAFDDWMEKHRVNVMFHVWPIRLLTEGKNVTGLEVASKSGRARLDASIVIDASVHGKIAKAWLPAFAPKKEISVLHLLYSGISGTCPEEMLLHLSEAGEVRVSCRPTFWNKEWRITLASQCRRSRAEWLLLLEEILIALRERIPALQSGLLANVADDVWGGPELIISAGETESSSECSIFEGMLSNPVIMNGLFLAGVWLEGYPFEPLKEETAIVNAFLLGDLVGRSVLQSGYAADSAAGGTKV